MTEIQKQLFILRDEKYGAFQLKLIPTVPMEQIIGVRVPALRDFAKSIQNTDFHERFLSELPHTYYDENMLHSALLSLEKDYRKSLEKVEAFLPFVDNWAVCDTLRPKPFAKHKEELFPILKKWISSKETYICRFGLEMLMTHYLDGDFKKEYLELPAAVKNEEYYVRMMIAWFFATALAKQWDDTVIYLEEKRLDEWTHNKTIQKACESFRVTKERKEYLKTLKI